MKYVLLVCILMLSACGGMSEYPRLLPTDRILAEPALPDHARQSAADPAPAEAVARDRADALRARADALRGPVVDPELRRRAAE